MSHKLTFVCILINKILSQLWKWKNYEKWFQSSLLILWLLIHFSFWYSFNFKWKNRNVWQFIVILYNIHNGTKVEFNSKLFLDPYCRTFWEKRTVIKKLKRNLREVLCAKIHVEIPWFGWESSPVSAFREMFINAQRESMLDFAVNIIIGHFQPLINCKFRNHFNLYYLLMYNAQV